MFFEPNSSTLENDETNRSESIFQDMDQTSGEQQNKPKEEESTQASNQTERLYSSGLCDSLEVAPNEDTLDAKRKRLRQGLIKDTVPKEKESTQESSQEWDHYWWCPCFKHLSSCSFANNGFQDPNWWPQMAVNPYYDPYNQMANSQRMKPNASDGKPKAFGVKPTKTATNQIERLYSCRLCHQMNETKDVESLRKHIEDHLGKSRPYICQLCGKHFMFRSNCRNHLIAHSVVRTNSCLFSQSSNQN